MKIFSASKVARLPEPNIAEFQNGLLVTLHKNVTENVTQNRRNKILKLIRENPEHLLDCLMIADLLMGKFTQD